MLSTDRRATPASSGQESLISGQGEIRQWLAITASALAKGAA
jgi:hypothetical protein